MHLKNVGYCSMMSSKWWNRYGYWVYQGKSTCAFGRIRKRLYKIKLLKTQLKSIFTITLPTLLFCLESWVIYQRYIKLLEHFQQRCLQEIFNIKWLSNIEFLLMVHLLYRSTVVKIIATLARSYNANAKLPLTKNHNVWKIIQWSLWSRST